MDYIVKDQYNTILGETNLFINISDLCQTQTIIVPSAQNLYYLVGSGQSYYAINAYQLSSVGCSSSNLIISISFANNGTVLTNHLVGIFRYRSSNNSFSISSIDNNLTGIYKFSYKACIGYSLNCNEIFILVEVINGCNSSMDTNQSIMN